MLKATEVIAHSHHHDLTLTLPYELRQKSRLRANLDNGDEIGVLLPRGTVLRGGDCLRSETGEVILVRAAEEVVSTVYEKDPTQFARACYHLGNRHVPLQIGEGWLRYLHDHVLDDMLHGLGLHAICERAPFEPEAGAYGGGHHHHHHDHEH